MKIVYMGTPEFAVRPLEALIEAGHDVEAVFTQPDRPKNRGLKASYSAVKECALKHGIDVFQPETFRDRCQESMLKELAPDILVVAAYGKLLPGYALRAGKYGAVNIHASLLPKYRGAAPIQRAVMNGDAVTGVTTMYMSRKLDEGDIIKQKEYHISPEDTAETVHDALSEMGSELIVETLELIKNGTAPRIPQTECGATYAPMLTKEDGRLDLRMKAKQVADTARGVYPWPGAFLTSDGKIYKVYGVGYKAEGGGNTGAVHGELEIECSSGVITIEEIQLQGKKRMSVEDFMRGHKLPERFDVKNDD